MTDAVHRGRRTLLLLALVFLGPLALAVGLYFTGFQWRPQATTEHGELYRPARPLPDLSMRLLGGTGGEATLHGKWTMMHIGPGACEAGCQAALVTTRQVRRALGRDMDRVQRVFVVTTGRADTGMLATEHPGIGVAGEDAATGELLRRVGGHSPGDVYLTDPLGNLVMRYDARVTMKGMHADLKRLLQVSTIG